MPVDIIERHANGASVQVTSIDVSDTEVRLGVRMVNGHTRQIDLNNQATLKRTFVSAGGDVQFGLVAPTGNQQLTIPPQSTMEGTLVFMGAIPSGAPLVLVFNENGSSSASSGNPLIRIELPADAVAASQGDGAKKN
ncbi:hypothetical protein [Marinivivus vitaminiproducens]|uniref:hypothetical protein n=1 Tax=Marinivivus vitaminiproducens TaxID=3035935 RepID=UPI0027A79A01|nr:hypothetical protein P4R82_00245 [Geminicoccaceae bacterium SCSIO 64248]